MTSAPMSGNWIPNRYKSFEELEQAIRRADIESIQMVFGFDFSKSNEYTGEKSYGKPLHGLDYVNPYLRILQIMEPIATRFDDDGIFPAYRFGCLESKNKKVVPLLSPTNMNPEFDGFDALRTAYAQATTQVKLCGPTTFGPMIREAIKIEQKEGGQQLLFVVIITDGCVSNVKQDIEAIVEASKYPISICAIGVGDGPFDTMIQFDDMEGDRKYDNFQFVNFTEFERVVAYSPNPDLELATLIFNELPEHVASMRRLGYM